MSGSKPDSSPAASKLKEVRYSLRELLSEVQQEREGSSIGQEIVDQTEIGKLFSSKKKVRRGKSRK
jgi:hypothetical protein